MGFTSASAVGVDLTTTLSRTFQNDTNQWILGRVLTSSSCSVSDGITQCRAETNTYDPVGRLGTRSFTASDSHDQPNADHDAYTEQFSYDAFGNLVSDTKSDIFGHVAISCAAYDAQGVFPTAFRDALNHFSYVAYDPRFGEKTAEVDPNLVATKWSYDGWGRPAQEVRVDGRNTTTSYTQVSDATQATFIQRRAQTVSGQDVTTQYDSAGRPTSIWSGTLTPYCTAPCPPKPLTAQYARYDTIHRALSAVSVPVDISVPPGSVSLWSTWTRDAAGRVTSAAPPFVTGTTIYRYSGNTTTTTEPLGIVKSATVDALGRLVQSVEPAGTTNYYYGPFSQLAKTDAQGFTDQWSDPVGNQTFLSTPDSGTTLTTYDGFHHPLTRTDAIPRTTTYTIDVAGRMLTRTDADGFAAWTWDTAANGLGQLASVTTAANPTATILSREDYQYDSAEQLSSRTLTVGGETFTTTLGYTNGLVTNIVYPAGGSSNVKITNAYDAYGNLTQATDATQKQVLWTLKGSDNEGHITSEMFGNNFVTDRTYYADKNTIDTIKTYKGSSNYQELTYVWDDRLNLHSRKDDLQPQPTYKTETFGYDSSDRVTCATFTSGCALSVSYDASGNIASKSDVGAYTYDVNHPHAVHTAGAGSYINDGVGNQIQRPDAQIHYTAANLPSRILPTAGGTITYDYDGLHDRIRKTTATDTTTYAGGMFERVAHSDGTKDYYYSVSSGERVVAVVNHHVVGTSTTVNTSYIHADYLGSPEVISSTSGSPEKRSFDAFGQQRATDWSQTTAPPLPSLLPVAYTGQENDAVKLIDMKGRTYDPHLGRMLQADPFTAHPTSLQGWNRFSYVENNPLKFTDPTGFQEQPLPSGKFDPGGGAGGAPPKPVSPDSGNGPPPGVDAGDGSTPAPTTDVAPTGPQAVDTTTHPDPDPAHASTGGGLSTGGGGFTSGQEVGDAIKGRQLNPNRVPLTVGALVVFGGGQLVASFSLAIPFVGPYWSYAIRAPGMALMTSGAGEVLNENSATFDELAQETELFEGEGGAVEQGAEAEADAAQHEATSFLGKKGWELQNLQTIRNTATTIDGRVYSGHALDQMQNRGIMPSVVQNTIEQGTSFATRAGTSGFYDSANGIRVILNSESGTVVTVIPGSP